jgi:hypothetical protein
MFFKYIILFIVILVTILPAGEDGRYWIYLKDKYSGSYDELPAYSDVSISERALKRRQLRGDGAIFDFTDLPISGKYITELENMGVEIYRQSRWLNAVSCYLNGVTIDDVINLPFVLKVEPVKTFIYKPVEKFEQQILQKPTAEEYGPSFNQNDMIGVPYAHEMGFHGENILIALFDQGFILDHEALQHIEVVDAWDFIYDDDDVADEDEDVPGQQNHGTQVLSTLAGYSPGKLIGPAYASQFLLAKTDHVTLENQQDEDNWVAAAEWAEGLGADMISSSVGYILDYTYEDMDGNTAAVTIAADLAVKKGVSVFVSAGNEGREPWEYIIAPADGDSVVAMGGVTTGGDYWALSSRGPTYDGRIKPDLVAQGQNVYCVNPGSTDRYTTADGTSLSCPLGAGAGAILLSIDPSLSPMALRDTLVHYASQANNPDTLMGYGIINLEEVIFDMIGDPVVSVSSFEAVPRDGNNLIQWVVDLEIKNEKWLISRKTPTTPFVEIGQIEGREFGISQETYLFYDFKVEGGEYFTYKLKAQFVSGDTIVIDTAQLQSAKPNNLYLSKNFPNPFNSNTKIIFGLNSPQKVNLKIYDITGKLVKTLIDNKVLDAQFHHILWDGSNDLNHSISSGMYYLRLTADGTQKMMKMLYLK